MLCDREERKGPTTQANDGFLIASLRLMFAGCEFRADARAAAGEAVGTPAKGLHRMCNERTPTPIGVAVDDGCRTRYQSHSHLVSQLWNPV